MYSGTRLLRAKEVDAEEEVGDVKRSRVDPEPPAATIWVPSGVKHVSQRCMAHTLMSAVMVASPRDRTNTRIVESRALVTRRP